MSSPVTQSSLPWDFAKSLAPLPPKARHAPIDRSNYQTLLHVFRVMEQVNQFLTAGFMV